jgi:TPR repeat protein
MAAQKIEELNALRQEAYRFLKRKDYRKSRELFERVFDGKEASIASCLGYIHSRRGCEEYDVAKAIEYFNIAARNGDTFAQYALGGLLRDRGEIDKALDLYRKASENGSSACSYILYQNYRSCGDNGAAERYFDRAVQQGNPPAIQRLSIRYLTGRFGLKGIPFGIYMYFKNIPALIRFTKANVSKS